MRAGRRSLSRRGALPTTSARTARRSRAAARSVRSTSTRARRLRGRAAADARPARCHYLEGAPEDVASYLLTLDAINFGSGWFPTLRKRPGPLRLRDGRLGAHRPLPRRGPVEQRAAARARRRATVAGVLGQRARPRADVAVRAGAARARRLARRARARSRWSPAPAARRSARRAARARDGDVRDRGFYKRAQIAPPTSRWPASRSSTTSTG